MAQNLATASSDRLSIDALKELVDKQADDDGLWFKAYTAAEGYLQQELRMLHDYVESLHKVHTGEGRNIGDQSCLSCGHADFADPETRLFVPVNSGTTSTPADPPSHWVEGWIVCRECGHTEWAGDSS